MIDKKVMFPGHLIGYIDCMPPIAMTEESDRNELPPLQIDSILGCGIQAGDCRLFRSYRRLSQPTQNNRLIQNGLAYVADQQSPFVIIINGNDFARSITVSCTPSDRSVGV